MLESNGTTSGPSTRAIKVFFSYSHKDEELRDKLANHLEILRRLGMISVWHDRDISAGTEWASKIDEHLNTAHVILLLISANFFASEYCWSVELERAMERHDAGEARVIPIILSSVDWKGAPFGKIQALPKNAVPVTSWPNIDEAFTNVAEGIRRTVDELNGTLSVHQHNQVPLGRPSNVPESPLAQTNQRVVVTGTVVDQDHKYNGELVLIELNFLNETENHTNRQVCIVLNITFGQVDEIIINGDQEGFIRFGVKHGKLRLNFENGDMPLSNRNSCNEWHDNWWVTTTGESTAPIWEIEANGNPLILRGLHSNQQLGMIDLFNDQCVLKAVFKVIINSNDIEITAQNGAWNNNSNKKTKETMIRGFFRNVLEPKIKDYVSKVVLNYGSTVIS